MSNVCYLVIDWMKQAIIKHVVAEYDVVMHVVAE